MKYLAKFVAGILMLAWCAGPLRALASCVSGADCAMHCGDCCAGMAKAIKVAKATGPSDVKVAMPAQTSQAPCCSALSGEPIAPAVRQGVQRSMVPTVSLVAFHAPAPRAGLPRSSHVPLDRRTGGRAQSVLCSFLI